MYTKVFENFGNLVSSSVPVGIATAMEDGLIKEGDSVSLVPASAGLSVAVVK